MPDLSFNFSRQSIFSCVVVFAVVFFMALSSAMESPGRGAAPPADTKPAAAPDLPPIAPGPFKPEWNSLTRYQTPDWFRDAKFGIWAHWGAQCEPEDGDWYARGMYEEGSGQYEHHLATYGHPSKFGFKDVIHQWKAEHFDPDKLLAFYKDNGAKYFVALAAHCDNFDNYDSKYQPWNSVKIGPHKDLIGGWAAAARKNGLRFGVSLHNGGWTWRWYEPAQGADTKGPFKGVPYDGKLTRADGKGQWWDGLDPQDLYAQNHEKGAPPDEAYCRKYYLRTRQLWDDYQPDLIYFDEGPLPMSYLGVDQAYGLNLYAHFYNSSIQRLGENQAVVTAKILNPDQRKAMVYDIERGKASDILPQPWQTDTCIGQWHYNRDLFVGHQYTGADKVIPMLVDIVSKNGNLLLSVPLQRDGQPDTDEIKIVSDIGAWLKVNGEAIYATRPWTIYGEGPSTLAPVEKSEFGSPKDVSSKPFTAEDIRFTQSKDGKVVYAIALGWPKDGTLRVKSLGIAAGKIESVSLFGHDGKIEWKQTAAGLVVTTPAQKPCGYAWALKIIGDRLQPALPADEVTGAIPNPGMTVLADQQGVQAQGYRFDPDCAKPSPWRAEWIWDNNDATEAAWFRKEVELPDAPQKVAAWLTADVKYQLYINGRLVARGPVDQGQDFAGGGTHRWFYDYRDLTPFFTQGKNVIAAKVFRKGMFGSVVSRGRPGFLFEGEITSPGRDKLIVKSDATWQALAAPVIQSQQVPGLNGAAWSATTVVPDVWSPLVASEIPPLMEARYPVSRIEGLPDNKTFTKNGSFKVIFDRVLSGFPILKIKGGKGAQITIHSHNAATLTLGGGEETFEYPFMDEIAPSYTVGVSNVTEPLEIRDAGAVFTSQPVEYKGAFECSDDGLNQLWKVSRWAVQICLQTHHLDSPNHQEPISDPGDYVIESMVNHYAFAQPWLARQDIRKFAWLLKDEKYHNFHTSYSLAWLQMLMDYCDYTGDRSLVVEMAPYVHELLDTYASWRGNNGIISEAPNYMFMDWVNIGGFAVHHPPAVIGQGYLTAFYYHGLDMGMRVAAMTGDTARVKHYEQLRGELFTAFNRQLWVADKGLYCDGKPFQTSVKPGQWLPADKDMQTFSPHVNLLAVLYDLAPRQQQAAIVEKVLSQKPLNTQPWFMHWVFQAIDHAGLFDQYGTDQMRRWQIVPETQSFREMWNGGDLSHGWCSTPLVQLSSRVLGITPSSPGFDTIAIPPELCDLKWARGIVPTPHGDVAVAWTLGEDGLKLDVTIPRGTQADVTLPVSRFGQPRSSMNGQNCGPTVHVSSGTYHFDVAGKLNNQQK